MASRSGILAWSIPRTEEPGGPRPRGRRVGHNCDDSTHTCNKASRLPGVALPSGPQPAGAHTSQSPRVVPASRGPGPPARCHPGGCFPPGPPTRCPLAPPKQGHAASVESRPVLSSSTPDPAGRSGRRRGERGRQPPTVRLSAAGGGGEQPHSRGARADGLHSKGPRPGGVCDGSSGDEPATLGPLVRP